MARPGRMIGGRAYEENMVKNGVSPDMAGNPNYQLAWYMGGGNKNAADSNYNLLRGIGNFFGGGGMSPDAQGGGSPPPSMSPTAGLKAVMPGMKSKGGAAKNRKR